MAGDLAPVPAHAVPSTVRNPPVQRRSRALLEQVLTAAGDAFDEDGVDGTSMEEIARRAGVSVGAVYRFFSNKADVVAALVERYGREHGATAASQLSPENLGRPADEVIGGYFRAFTALVARQPGCRGLSRAGHLFGSSSLADTWTSDIDRLLAAQAPNLSAAARRRSARTFTALSGWLILHAIESGDAIGDELGEAATVMIGYIHELQR